MLKFLLLALLNGLLLNLISQNVMLSSEERAYLYHVAEKSPTLQRNIGDLFNYKGDTVYFKFKVKRSVDSILDFDSIDQNIIYEPSLLEINAYELSSVENGLLAELASKLALQNLYRELNRKDEIKTEGISNRVYARFLEKLTTELPSKATRSRNDKNEPIPKVIELLSPSLSFFERANQLKELDNFKLVEQQQIMDAIFKATQLYIQEKGEEYYRKIGGQKEFYSYLQAVGDGSSTSGLLGERELIREGKHEIGKPKGIGLFTYETGFKTLKGNKQVLSPKQSVTNDFTPIKEDLTSVHFSMWGFNKKLQTTVAIRNKDSVYLLYASKVNKELTPDTTFGSGSTIHSITNKLENKSIPELDEAINGKTGLKFKLEEAKEARELNLLKIKETEYELKSGSQKNNKLKKKNKIVTRENGGAMTANTRGQIKRLQNKLAYLINRQTQIEKILANAEADLKEEEARMQSFRARLTELKSFIDGKQLTYNKFGYIYTFADGCTFNSYTQTFKIPKALKIKDFSVRLITIGPNAMSERVDEIQLLTNVTRGIEEDIVPHSFELTFNDVFDTDKYNLKSFYIKETERFELSKLLYQSLVLKKQILFDVKGNGVGKIDKGVIIASAEKELDAYPGETKEEQAIAKLTDKFKMLRSTKLKLYENEENIVLAIESFTDPVKSNFSKKSIKVQPIKEKYKLSENQLLSVFRSYTVLEKFYGELLRAANFHFEGNEKDKLLNNVKKAFEKSTISAGTAKVSTKEIETLLHSESSYYEIKMEQFRGEEEKIKTLLEF